jgi:hypothetical protein
MRFSYRTPIRVLLLCTWVLALVVGAQAEATLKALVVDGQNNHPWQETTPFLKSLLEETGLFKVDVATTPPARQPMDNFKPEFSKYDVIVLNYNGDDWPEATRNAFEEYVKNGGGVVVFHAANNAFPNWKAYNEIIAVGGWGNRNEKSGPMIRLPRRQNGARHHDPGAGRLARSATPFLLEIRDKEHLLSRRVCPRSGCTPPMNSTARCADRRRM